MSSWIGGMPQGPLAELGHKEQCQCQGMSKATCMRACQPASFHSRGTADTALVYHVLLHLSRPTGHLPALHRVNLLEMEGRGGGQEDRAGLQRGCPEARRGKLSLTLW